MRVHSVRHVYIQYAYFAACFVSVFHFVVFVCSCFFSCCVLFVLCFVCLYDPVFRVVFLTDLRIYIYIPGFELFAGQDKNSRIGSGWVAC